MMLLKCVTQDGKNLDKLLPYVLFTYREGPHESTEFLPFEFLYGRKLQGSLDLLKEGLEANPGASKNVMSHVLLIRDRLEMMARVVQQNKRGHRPDRNAGTPRLRGNVLCKSGRR